MWYGQVQIASADRVTPYPYSVRMRENPGKMLTRVTPNTDSFYAVLIVKQPLAAIQDNNFAKYLLPGVSEIS